MTGADRQSARDLAQQAWEAYRAHRIAEAIACSSRASKLAASTARRLRQEIEVVGLAVTGDRIRAHDLAAEHLVEFPTDDLVRQVKAALECPRPTPDSRSRRREEAPCYESGSDAHQENAHADPSPRTRHLDPERFGA